MTTAVAPSTRGSVLISQAVALMARGPAGATTSPASEDAIWAVVAQVAVKHLADLAFIAVRGSSDGLTFGGVAGVSPARIRHLEPTPRMPSLTDELQAFLQSFTCDPGRSQLIARALDTGESTLLPDGEATAWQLALAADPPAPVVQRPHVHSLMVVPLPWGGRALAALVLGRVAGSLVPFCLDDVRAAEDLARFAALGVANVRLTLSGTAARRVATEARAVAERLQTVTTALSAATSLEQAAQVGVEQIAALLQAAGGALALVDQPAGVMRVVSSCGVAPGRLDNYRQIPLSARLPVVDAVKWCRPVLLESPEALAAYYPDTVAHSDPRYRAWATIPFLHEGQPVGVAWFMFVDPQSFGPGDEAVMMSIGRQAALAIVRARTFEAERTARERVERVLGLTRQLEEVTRRVSRAMSIDAMADAAIAGAAAAFHADSSAIYLVDEARGELRMLAEFGLQPQAAAQYARIPLQMDAPLTVCVQRCQPVFLEGRQMYAHLYPASEARLRAYEGDTELSMACVPLVVNGRAQGALIMVFRARRQFDEDERRFVSLLADHCALALARADLFEREREARVVAEDALSRAQKADRRKDEFLAMLGHELRNPLAPISTALQLVRLRPADPFEREHAIIDRQVKHLERLVDDLLDVSRITRGKVDLKRERIELTDLIAEAIDVSSPSLELKSHRLEVDVPRGIALVGDHVRLCQVLANLLTNAAKYTDQGGQIAVRAQAVGGQVVIAVRDNGIGIDAGLQPHVFEIFTQAPQTIERSQGGLGLGLTIVKQIVELHGGSVEVKSDGQGTGSEFIVRLPMQDADGLPPAAADIRDDNAAPAAGKPRARRIVVVDDNEDAAAIMAEALSLLGHDVQVANDGPSALQVVKSFAPDVVCLDIGLPVMDGYEVARRLRQDHTGPLRIVAITGYGQDQDRANSRSAGFDAHLVKPVDLDVLLAACTDPT